MGTTVCAVFGNFWKKHYHWRVFDSHAGRTINDPTFYLFMRFFAAIIQSAFVFALFPIYNYLHRENISFWQISLKDYRPREGFIFDTADEFIAYEIRQSIKESLAPPAVQSILGYSSSDISADRFRTVWNALVGRSTTKPEDLHIILANLLGFNAGYMMEEASEPSQRMAASKFISIGLSSVQILQPRNVHHNIRSDRSTVLGSMNELPLDLLFLEVKKAGLPGKADWIPLYPGQGRLKVKSKMTRATHGYFLHVDVDSKISVFRISSVPGSLRQFRLSSYVQDSDVDANESEQYYWIEDSKLPPSDQVASEEKNDQVAQGEKDVYIIFHNTASDLCRGARFNVLKTKKNIVFLQYDGAVQVFKAETLQWDPDSPSFRARRRPEDSILLLKHNLAPMGPLPRRSLNAMLEKDAKINRVARIVGLGIIVASFGFMIIIGGLVKITLITPGSQVRLAIDICFPVWTIALWTSGFTLPYDITRYSMQIIWSQYWTATFQENWKPGDKVRHGWIRGLLDSIWRKFHSVKRMLMWLAELRDFMVMLGLIVIGFPFEMLGKILSID
ncbi:MAG: hypothetical protein Q9195_005393 [Heterodermia aff. obscurata]